MARAYNLQKFNNLSIYLLFATSDGARARAPVPAPAPATATAPPAPPPPTERGCAPLEDTSRPLPAHPACCDPTVTCESPRGEGSLSPGGGALKALRPLSGDPHSIFRTRFFTFPASRFPFPASRFPLSAFRAHATIVYILAVTPDTRHPTLDTRL